MPKTLLWTNQSINQSIKLFNNAVFSDSGLHVGLLLPSVLEGRAPVVRAAPVRGVVHQHGHAAEALVARHILRQRQEREVPHRHHQERLPAHVASRRNLPQSQVRITPGSHNTIRQCVDMRQHEYKMNIICMHINI